ncbi:hypothetical protein Hypma_009798 [Hypsizygus marmoreus]|uniref:F-box domain-containing protein n=1 Tax=Hypsizygus marmoreus TaxID=39966 RepID=A0A369JNV6_HYPMA|nr:hypothetical protein Hypma_009798 [Hypsizygus marmoreus]
MNTGRSSVILVSRASSLDHVLQTNNPPSDNEVEEIQILIQDIKECMEAQDRFEDPDVHDFEPHTREQLKDLNSACRSALSPLRRFPAEIISYIFSQIMRGIYEFADEGWMSLNTTKEPWTFAQVCGWWRTVALAHQEIWSYVRIDMEALKTNRTPEPSLAALQCCLQRSGAHTLSIHFTDSYPPTTRTKELFSALVPHCRQWKVVTFSVFFEHLELLVTARGNLRSLQSLTLIAYGTERSSNLDVFEIAPQLRDVSLGIDITYTQLSLPWPQLTKIIGWRAIDLSFLHHATSLEGCSLTFSPFHIFPAVVSPIRIPSLRRLRLDTEYPLDGLAAPALEDLGISSIYMRATALQHITSFVHRSSCSLRSLLLHDMTIDSEFVIMPLLDSIPSLAFLQVKRGQVDWNELVRVLTITKTRRLVPNLKVIRFIFDINLELQPDFEPSLLLDMIESRFYQAGTDAATNLESITLLEVDEPLPEQCMARLAKLEEQGLKVADDTRPEEDVPSVVSWAAWDGIMN